MGSCELFLGRNSRHLRDRAGPEEEQSLLLLLRLFLLRLRRFLLRLPAEVGKAQLVLQLLTGARVLKRSQMKGARLGQVARLGRGVQE